MTEDRNHDRGDDHRDRLTTLLRQADPAADAPGLDATEAARMRQAIARAADRVSPGGLEAVGWRDWMAPALAAAAITALALGAWLITGGSFTEAPEVADAGQITRERSPVPEPTPAPIDRGAPISPQITPDTPTRLAEAAPTPADPVDLATVATVEAEAAAESTRTVALDNPSPPDKRARTVQFTAPGGTRIIWTLDPNFEPPIAGQEPRQEQPR